MILKEISPKIATKELLKFRPQRKDIDLFKNNLSHLLDKVNDDDHEEHQKNHIRDFLINTFYKDTNAINTKDKADLVIHLGKSEKDKVGVILETKRPGNKLEMLNAQQPNTKALHELVLYYMRERVDNNNIDIKNCVVTNIYEWYIFDAQEFERLFYKNKEFLNKYKDWRDNKQVASDTSFFYNSVVKPHIEQLNTTLNVTYFDIREYKKELKSTDNRGDKKLIALYKTQSPYHLLKKTAVDSNALNDKFYKELLYIIGLEETKEGGKVVISRKKANRNDGALLELAIATLETKDLYKISNASQYGSTKDERQYSIALELCLTWINRVLFLKLLEGQLVDYQKGNQNYKFLDIQTVHDFDELYSLFHKVLAKNYKERNEKLQDKYKHVPYLNSSLFELSKLEEDTLGINQLDNNSTIELMPNSVLLDKSKKRVQLTTIDYLFRFLSAYDFASEGKEEIQENNRSLINASVLGKVFEKINGYKDGSVYTPGFITMYMCKETIRRAVVQKFSKHYKKEFANLNDIYSYLDVAQRKEANEIVNSLKICDPAVGSGHFLVSALNEIIAIKAELGILIDENGKRIKDYTIEVINDELVMTDEYGDPFIYNPKHTEYQRIQKTLFQEKQTIIENSLFGVDINANSVKICRLRLWIELLKHAYYKEESGFTELETLPNIDINIKTGNSLLSRYGLDEDLGKALKDTGYTIAGYKEAVHNFKNATGGEDKWRFTQVIDAIKKGFETYFSQHDERREKLSKARGELVKLQSDSLFETKKTDAENKKKIDILKKKIEKIETEIEQIRSNIIYQNAFEWRFEFPEVLDNEGNFEGFDILIGNPPYIQLQKMGEATDILQQQGYQTFVRTGDIYCLFYEQGAKLLKPGGLLCFITSNKWMRAGYGESIRSFLVSDLNPIQLIDFAGFQLFDSATVDTNILLLEKGLYTGSVETCIINSAESIKNMSDYFQQHHSNNSSFTGNGNWVILSSIESEIRKKIDDNGLPLKHWDIRINYGIKTGFNDAFIIDESTKNDLESKSPESAEIIRPILRGKHIKKYGELNQKEWLILIPFGWTNKNRREIEPETYFKRMYPSVYEHLINKSKEPSKGKGLFARDDKGDYWWELRPCDYLEEFSKEKILYIDIMTDNEAAGYPFPNFSYAKGELYILNTAYFMVGESKMLKYILAILNSKVGKFIVRNNVTPLQKRQYRMFQQFVDNFPIAQADIIKTDLIVDLVNKVLGNKALQLDTTNYENMINEKVIEIYGLNREEREFILTQE